VLSVFFNASTGTSLGVITVSLLYFVAGLVGPTLFLAIDGFSNAEIKRTKSHLVLIFGPYILLAIGFLYPGMIVGYEEVAMGDTLGRITFGELFIPYALYAVFFVIYGCYLLINNYRKSAGIFRVQMGNFLTTFITTGLVALSWTLFIPFFLKSQEFFWVGYIGGAILFLVVTGFILVKYNFWNIKIIATEFFISLVIFVLIVELFIASSPLDLFVKTAITIIVIISSLFLVGSVRREIQSRDRIVGLMNDLKEISKRLKVLDRKKTEFLSIASHHLRDPLTAIKGYASMLAEGSYGKLSKPLLEAVEKIYVSSEHLITMISDFMDVARIEGGDMKYVFSNVDMKKLVLDLTDTMRQNAGYSRVILSTTIDDRNSIDESFITVGDEGKLRQVVSNLVDNSIKYTPMGEVSIMLSKSKDRKKIIFSVSDTGIGMSKDTIEKIFNKFSRAEGVSKIYTEGTGLGLYVAKEIIKKHEGRIWGESKGEGHGSSFYVELDAKM